MYIRMVGLVDDERCHPEWSEASKCFLQLASRTRGICSAQSAGADHSGIGYAIPPIKFQNSLRSLPEETGERARSSVVPEQASACGNRSSAGQFHSAEGWRAAPAFGAKRPKENSPTRRYAPCCARAE